jgi:hypothetical protein
MMGPIAIEDDPPVIFETPSTHARRGLRRALVALLLAVLTPGGALGARQAAAGAATPTAAVLDLSAMALRPADIAGQPYGLLEAEVWHTAPDSVAAYYSSLGLVDPASGGETLLRRINTTFDQFADPTAAQVYVDAFREEMVGVDQDPAAQRHTVPDAPVVGEDSVTTLFTTTTDDGRPVNALEVTFRTGSVVVDLRMSDFQGAVPAFAELAPLVDVLIGRIGEVAAAPAPLIGQRALHIGPAGEVVFTVDFESYLQVDGVAIRQTDDTEESFQERSARLAAGKVDDFYLVQQTLDPSGTEDPAQAVRYLSRLFMFPTKADAAAYVDRAVSDVLAVPGDYRNPAEVPLSGFTTAARAISYDLDYGGGQTASGFRTWVQAGAAVVSIQVDRIGGVVLQGVQELTAAQAACATSGTPCAPVPLPTSLAG